MHTVRERTDGTERGHYRLDTLMHSQGEGKVRLLDGVDVKQVEPLSLQIL